MDVRRAIITLQRPTASAANDSGHHSIPASLIPTAATTTRAKPVKPASPKVGSATSATMRAEASTTHSSTTAGSFATSVIPGSLNAFRPPVRAQGARSGPGARSGRPEDGQVTSNSATIPSVKCGGPSSPPPTGRKQTVK